MIERKTSTGWFDATGAGQKTVELKT